MGIVTRRRAAALQHEQVPEKQNDTPPDSESDTSSTASEQNEKVPAPAPRRGMTLKDRSRVPPSAYMCATVVFLLQYLSNRYTVSNAISWYESMITSLTTILESALYTKELAATVVAGDYREPAEYLKTATAAFFALSLTYVVLIAPLMAGFWTGARISKQKFHRYMGLLWLIQYACAWVEFLTNYEDGADVSVVPQGIAMNGILQAWSAYFSFKVLPNLDDAGYYSDKAVLSRNFVHENVFFQMMTVFGSIYYNGPAREALRTHTIGRIIEFAFVFWPYVVIRTFFPITRFSNAGTTHKGRTTQNQKFYEIGTLMVKFFFLWAKYFCGFYFNFLVFLDLVTEDKWPLVHGMFLLNGGTVSLAVFLHTLRFKKVLPPKLTFSLYLVQIYASFTAIPIAYDLFAQHKELCGVALAGMLCNMTRSRKIHAVWCLATMYLLACTDFAW